jgi:hypothetical protein
MPPPLTNKLNSAPRSEPQTFGSTRPPQGVIRKPSQPRAETRILGGPPGCSVFPSVRNTPSKRLWGSG